MRSLRIRSRNDRVLHRVVLFALLACLPGGCYGPSAIDIELRPGHSLFDLLSHAELQHYPETSLPPELQSMDGAPIPLVRTLRARWQRIELEDRSPLQTDPGALVWRVLPHLTPPAPSPAPRIVIDGSTIDLGAGEPTPRSLDAWWDEDSGLVFARSNEEPSGVLLEYPADPAGELGRYERRLVIAATKETSGTGGRPAPPSPEALVQRENLGGVGRPCLLLPAPSSLTLRFASFPGDSLAVAVGVVNRSYRAANRHVERGAQGSDGVDFLVEVETDGSSEVVWRRAIGPREVGRRFYEAVVDLERFEGESIALHLRSDPGPDGDSTFDYALWGDLRMMGAPERRPDRPHVVIIDIDTLRADRLGVYGYERPTTPRLDDWAARSGIVYRDAIATSSWTLPSTASILTGLAPHQHRIEGTRQRLTPGTSTLATMLRAAGYETLGVMAGPFFGGTSGFDSGFDRFDSVPARIGKHWRAALSRLRGRRSERPVFLLLHTMMTHSPYRPDDRFTKGSYRGSLAGQHVGTENATVPYARGEIEFDEVDRRYINALYDAGVARMDRLVGEVLDEVEAILGTNTMIVFTSDHGEEFWDHGLMGHGHSLYSELLRVPLIIQYPSPDRRSEIAQRATSLLDIAPTVLDVAGVEMPAGLPGRSLREALPEDRVRVAQLTNSHRAILHDGRMLILGATPHPRWPAGPVQLYDLREDPKGLSNHAGERPEVVRELRRRLEEWVAAFPPPLLTEPAERRYRPDQIERLRALGYLD